MSVMAEVYFPRVVSIVFFSLDLYIHCDIGHCYNRHDSCLLSINLP